MHGVALTAALTAALGGCSVPKEAGFADIHREVEARTRHSAFWSRGGEGDARIATLVDGMIAHPLAIEEAVQIALVSNRRLQATYEELSISQADVVQAGLLQNPVLSGGLQLPISGKGSVIHVGIEQDFLSLLMLPARKRLAEAAFEATKLRVAHEVVSLGLEVKIAYLTLQAAEQIVAVRRQVLDAADAALELATRQSEAGTLGELELENEREAFDRVRIEQAKGEVEVGSLREKLDRLMGLWGAQASRWSLAAGLPPLPPDDPTAAHLEALAVTQRLDVLAAEQEVVVRTKALAVASDWRWLGSAQVGADFEHEPDGNYLGPTASAELPLFDQKQALVARLDAARRQAEATLYALAVDVRSEVRQARARLGFSRRLAEHYRDVVIPRRERLVALTQQHYDAMLMGVYQLLAAKQAELDGYREYVEATRDYWIARAELERAVGGRLPANGRQER